MLLLFSDIVGVKRWGGKAQTGRRARSENTYLLLLLLCVVFFGAVVVYGSNVGGER